MKAVRTVLGERRAVVRRIRHILGHHLLRLVRISDSTSGTTRQVTLMTPQGNLVQKWTAPEETSSAGSTSTPATRDQSLNPQSNLNLAGKLSSLPYPQQLVVQQQLLMMQARRKSGSDYGVLGDASTLAASPSKDATNPPGVEQQASDRAATIITGKAASQSVSSSIFGWCVSCPHDRRHTGWIFHLHPSEDFGFWG